MDISYKIMSNSFSLRNHLQCIPVIKSFTMHFYSKVIYNAFNWKIISSAFLLWHHIFLKWWEEGKWKKAKRRKEKRNNKKEKF